MLDKLREFIEKVNSMFLYLVESIKTIYDKLNNITYYIQMDAPDTRVSVATVKSFPWEIPEKGVYILSWSNEWGVDSDELFTVAYLQHESEIVAFSRNSMRAGGGQNLNAIIYADKGDKIEAGVSWHGGSGSCAIQRIKFRAVRIGGGIIGFSRRTILTLFNMLSRKAVIAC